MKMSRAVPTCRVYYMDECSQSIRDQVESWAEKIRTTFDGGIYLIKIWKDGKTVGFYHVK